MKLLHTADWHLGAKTEGRSRIEEQREVLDEIVKLAEKERVNVVIIAGDVFDQAVPTSEAEDLFYETLDKLTAGWGRAVVVIAGNHDDANRLTAGEHFARRHNVVLAGNLNPRIMKKEESGIVIDCHEKGSVEVIIKTNNGEEKCVLAMLPYPAEYRFNEKAVGESYSEKVGNWARLVTRGFKKDSFNVLVSHLMVVGSKRIVNGEEEILRVGDINAVSKSDLPNADFYALGHLHGFQSLKGNVVYSGAPLFYDYAQPTAGVCIVETTGTKLKKVEFRPLSSPKKMVEIDINGIINADEALKDFDPKDIVNVTFIQDEPLSMVEIKQLKSKYPCIAQVKLRSNLQIVDDKNYIQNRTALDSENLFINFYKHRKGVEPDRALVQEFKQMMEAKDSETN